MIMSPIMFAVFTGCILAAGAASTAVVLLFLERYPQRKEQKKWEEPKNKS